MAPGKRPRNGEAARQKNRPKIGRPRKYHSKEEADSARRRLARDLYHRRKSKAEHPVARKIRFDRVLGPEDFEGVVPSSPSSTPMEHRNDEKPSSDASRHVLDSFAHPLAQAEATDCIVNSSPPSDPSLQTQPSEMTTLQIDEMLKATGDLIRSCQESTRCGCYMGPVDLVCTMSVFEQTASCFDYIAKSGFDGNSKVGTKNFCGSVANSVSIKQMLVLDLVRQSETLLSSVGAITQKMMVPPRQKDSGIIAMNRSPVCLNQLNLAYIREATATFEKLFGLIIKVYGKL
ncbi:hypothetical protein ASPCADRAFT_8676 [Aspergillus carbonarius ITEM 5010]|uniref:Uncharacterized protein n=1 Tax=Aspergillus carbonarius (strain ITEM 5010) TaxID=602072 RepID=A0A1R3RD43_ASPC5|nr:hypothetical protein ASPCADRAFT_8676 [Aspergillus carbonarius ITEM 5010]